MKKKLLLLTVLVMAFVCLFVVSASAEVTTYDDAPTKTVIQTSTDDLVVFDDGFTCPSAYICKDQTGLSLDFSWINEKASKSYTVANVVELDIPEGITTIGDRMFSKNEVIKRASIPQTAVNLGICIFEYASSLEQCTFEHPSTSSLIRMPHYMFAGCTSLIAMSLPDCIQYISPEKDGTLYNSLFSGCTSLTALYLPRGLKTLKGDSGASAVFYDCTNMYFVEKPFEYDNIPSKPDIYYFPEGLEYFKGETFKKCTGLNSVLVFGEKITDLSDTKAIPWAFNGCGNTASIVFLGDITGISVGNSASNSYWNVAKIYFANENDKSLTDVGFYGNSSKAVFCNAEGNTTHLAEKDEGTRATCINDQYVETYCFCGALIEKTVKENTKTGDHVYVTNDCTVSVKCTDDEACTQMSTPNAEHALTHTLVYADGFGANGLYNHYCSNENCTMADKEVFDVVKNPIITFKGYSFPEKEENLAINVGYEINYTLLNEYEKVTGEAVTLSLFMVNSQTKDSNQNKVNISAIFKNDNLDFADGVKGFCVQVNKSSYNSISLTIKGFDKGENYGGSYYALRLISAVVVQTTKDTVTKTHYVQATLDTTDTITVNNVDFVIITASAVYKDPIPTTQK